jgi:hypothetical protein
MLEIGGLRSKLESKFGGDVWGSSDKLASLILLDNGIDGIQYPAEYTSKGTHEEAFNYVVFDENAVEINEHLAFEPQTQYQRLPETIEINGVQRPTTNSNGKPIHSTEKGIRNFYKWFKNSKVVDENGRPLVVYHGSISDFNEFKLIDSEIFGSKFGHFFTPDKQVAQIFADRAENGILFETYLKLENPQKINGFFFNSYGKFKGADAKLRSLSPKELKKGSYSDISLPDFKKFREQLQSDGKDGVVLNNMSIQGEKTRIINTSQYVVFNPTQIKSATGNNGEFDGGNASILNEPTQLLSGERLNN